MQTASNACASVALLNIVNNIPGIDLGEHLQHFKDFTIHLHQPCEEMQSITLSLLKEYTTHLLGIVWLHSYSVLALTWL